MIINFSINLFKFFKILKLIFKNTGSTENFSNWLKQFKDINPSILIEIDTENQKFISKTYTEDKALVRYSFIPFDKCNLKLDSIKDNDNKKVKSLDKRIKAGIFMILPKFITVVDTFASVDHFIEFLFDEIVTEAGNHEYHSQAMVFKSKSLKMRVEDCSIQEFDEITDDVFFNKVCQTIDPVEINISTENIKNLINISNIFTLDSYRDHMMFYITEDNMLNVKNPEESLAGRSGSYDYTIGKVDNPEDYNNLHDVKLNVLRSKFLMAVKNITEDFKLIISTDMIKANRIIFETSNTTTVIAILKN